jgi:hypothetical protein
LGFTLLKPKTSALQDTLQRMKRQGTEWEKVFAEYIPDGGLVLKIYKQLLKLKSNKITQFKNGPKP